MCKTITGQIGGSNLRKKIKQTDHYKIFTKFRRNIFLNSNNIKRIQLALNIIENVGFKKWNKQSSYNHNNTIVIKQLTQNQFKIQITSKGF